MRVHPDQLRSPHDNLAEVLPLDAPYLITLSLSDLCDLACDFCPTGHPDLRSTRKSVIMNNDLYKSIIHQLVAFHKKIRLLNFTGDGEPLLNVNMVAMIRYAVYLGVAERYWLRTNGVRLEPKVNTALAKSGLNQIGISVKAFSDTGYMKVSKRDVEFARLVRNVADLYDKCKGKIQIYVSTLDYNLTNEGRERFYQCFEEISDLIAIEDVHGWTSGFDRVKPSNCGVEKLVCPFPFYVMGIKADGTVSACQEDWAHKLTIGDTNTDSLKRIWNGTAREHIMRVHLAGECNRLTACKNCSYRKFALDNIDESREELKCRLFP